MDYTLTFICVVFAVYAIDYFVTWAKFVVKRLNDEMDREDVSKQAEEVLWPVAHLQLGRDPMAGDQIVFYTDDGRYVMDMEVKSVRQVNGHEGAKGWQ